MSIYLAKDVDGVDAYSEGDNTDPIIVELLLDGSNDPTEIVGQPAIDLFLYANDHSTTVAGYSNIELGIVNTEPGITWELSIDGLTGWGASIVLADLDVSITAQAVPFYIRATAINEGSIITGNYTLPKLSLSAREVAEL